MRTDSTFSINSTGEETGNPFSGDFSVKGTLTRRDRFEVDRLRRQIVGASPEGTPPTPQVQAEAYMLATLAVRVINAPKWWEDADNGLDLEDYNIIVEVFDLMLGEDQKTEDSIKKDTEKVTKKMKKKDEKEAPAEDM